MCSSSSELPAESSTIALSLCCSLHQFTSRCTPKFKHTIHGRASQHDSTSSLIRSLRSSCSSAATASSRCCINVSSSVCWSNFWLSSSDLLPSLTTISQQCWSCTLSPGFPRVKKYICCCNQRAILLQPSAYAAAVHMLLHLLLRCICCCNQLHMLLQSAAYTATTKCICCCKLVHMLLQYICCCICCCGASAVATSCICCCNTTAHVLLQQNSDGASGTEVPDEPSEFCCSLRVISDIKACCWAWSNFGEHKCQLEPIENTLMELSPASELFSSCPSCKAHQQQSSCNTNTAADHIYST